MKKIIFILLASLIGFARAEDKTEELEVKLIENVAKVITEKKNPIVYPMGYEGYKISKYSKNLVVTNTINKADFIIIGNNVNVPKNINRLAISLDLKIFKDCAYCIAVLYWKKGRPQLIFSSEKITKFKINLPVEYKQYVKTEREISK